MRTKIIAANWKMNMDYPAGLALFSNTIGMIHGEVTGFQQTVVCCPFIHLHGLEQLAIGHPLIFVGAENCHEAESGAFTGEISAGMIETTEERAENRQFSILKRQLDESVFPLDIDLFGKRLIGGASLDARQFVDIVKAYN